MKKIIFSCLFFSSIITNVFAGSLDPKSVAGGLSWNPNLRKTVLPPHDNPQNLSQDKAIAASQRNIITRAKQLAENSGNLSLLLVQNGKIIFEHYTYPSSSNTLSKSWSMSKSLTAMLIGIKHCQGDIPNLDRSAESYAPSLKGTAFGKASVRDLLKMSSGAQKTSINHSGEHRSMAWKEIAVLRTLSIDQYLKEHSAENKTFFSKSQPGKEFSYNNLDTVALEKIISSTSRLGFIEEFHREIWKKSKPENFGVWLQDRNGQAIAYAGFNATARDWARMALLSINMLNDPDPCIRNYMKLMTTHQITTDRPVFTQYGYQTWVANWNGNSSYWWRGYAGQRVGIDPTRNLIMIVSSWNDDYQSQIYDLFREWQAIN